jgi:hypothetical protein
VPRAHRPAVPRLCRAKPSFSRHVPRAAPLTGFTGERAFEALQFFVLGEPRGVGDDGVERRARAGSVDLVVVVPAAERLAQDARARDDGGRRRVVIADVTDAGGPRARGRAVARRGDVS